VTNDKGQEERRMSAGGFNSRYLVSTQWLADRLDEPDLRIYDCTTVLVPDPVVTYTIGSGRDGYEEGHIPGAGYIHCQDDLSDASAQHRFMLADPQTYARNVGRLGIGDGVRVVLYSRTQLFWSTRAWWTLHAYGFDDAAVLDGGFIKWQVEGRPVSTAACAYPPATFTPRPRREVIAGSRDVLARIGRDDTVIVNALAREQHAGTGGNTFGTRAGHIAGSVNAPYAEIADMEAGTFRSPEEVRKVLAGAGATPDKRIVNYCGGGISATIGYLAERMLGYGNTVLYDASMQEWALDDSLPMERD
jgi:thiosulfate/3-mercaptopyruvate sulfurtransferase